MSTPPQTFWPDVIDEAGPKTHFALTVAQNAIQDHDRALISLKKQVDAMSSGSGGSSGGGGGSTPTTPVTPPPPTTPTLGTVTVVTAPTYVTQTSDYGGIVVFNSAVPMAVELNFAVAMQWFATYENIGAGLVTMTPTAGFGALVNGAASISISTNSGCVVYFDGANFWALTVPSALVLQTNGVVNGSQSVLNLAAGTGVTLTDNGSGTVTIASSGGGGGASRGPLQSNANGWWWVWSDGVIEQFGQLTIAPNTNEVVTGLILFPTAFATTVMNFEMSLVGLPNTSVSNAAAVQASTVGLTTAGVDLQCSVPTGGGGVNFDLPVVVNWRAIGI